MGGCFTEDIEGGCFTADREGLESDSAARDGLLTEDT